MGPKGKTKKTRDKLKRASETACIKRQISKMDGSLEQLKIKLENLEKQYSDRTAELFLKQQIVHDLNKKIGEVDVQVKELTEQRSLGILDISNLTRELNNQQHRISRKQKIYTQNSKTLVSYSDIKNLCFSMTTTMAGKMEVVQFSD